jgi:hypothetical protein
MWVLLSDLFFFLLNLILTVSLLGTVIIPGNTVQMSDISKEAKAVVSIISLKGNILTSNKNELTNRLSYEVKSFQIPKTIAGYPYEINFFDKGKYVQVELKIKDLDLKEKSIILKNGCKIENTDGLSSFTIESDVNNRIIMNMSLDRFGDCRVLVKY